MASVQKMGEGMAGVHRKRSQHWKNFLLKITMRPCCAFWRQFCHFAHVNPVLRKFGQQFIFPQRALRSPKPAHGSLDTIECTGWNSTVRPNIGRFTLDLMPDPG